MSSFDTLVIHPTSRLLLHPYTSALPHALLLHGDEGVGLFTVSQLLAGKQLAAVVQPKNAKGDVDRGGTISVEAIRQLYEQTRAKHTGAWVIIIDDAERMSHGAQSAFLKLLEEPNDGTHFILTAHQPVKLLPTIRSRVQALQLLPVTPEQTLDFIAQQGITDQKHRIQLRYIADGLPAELYRLIHDNVMFEAKATVIGDARDFLQADAYKKALVVQKYKSDRNGALQLVDSTIAILRKTMSAKPEDRIIQQLKLLIEIKERLQTNCNVTLQLMRFVL